MDNSTNPAVPAKGSWKDIKTKLKAKFATLTDEDLRYAEGKREEMMNTIQLKIGKTRDELNKIIAGL